MDGVRVTINISGLIFETRLSTLDSFPQTLLGSPRKRQKYFRWDKNEYFFSRNRKAFDAILFFYQSNGKLHRPEDVPMVIFKKEVEFFELGDEVVDKMLEKEGYLTELEITPPRNVLQKKIWDLLEPRQSSFKATAFGLVSVVLVIASIVTSVLQTLPCIQQQRRSYKNDFDDPWFVTELLLNSWFVVEYSLRFFASQLSKISFATSPLNVVEVAATLPFFVIYAITSAGKSSTTSSVAVLKVLRIARVFRVFRVFKLSQFSRSLRVIKHCVIESMREFGLLLLFLIIMVTVSSSFLYYVEVDEKKTHFTSVPTAMWFSLQTVTTIGYGDMVPVTTLGKLATAIYAIFGAFTITLPVLAFVTSFNKLYYNNLESSIRRNRLKGKQYFSGGPKYQRTVRRNSQSSIRNNATGT